ncbi:MAG TPA: glycosyltransferase family 9 protein [Burkholderiales bacterium]
MKILVVRRDNIGDLVCTTPLIAGLRAAHPKAWIGALVNTYNAEVLARNPALDAVHAYEKIKHRRGSIVSNLLERLRLRSHLRSAALDAVLVPSASRQALRLARGLRPGQVISESSGVHEVERAFSLGAALGVEGTPGPMRVFPDPAIVEKLRERIGEGFIAVHISARRAAQRWPLERYQGLINELTKTSRVVLLWAPGPQSDPRHPGDDAAASRLSAMSNLVKLPTPDLGTLIGALSLARLAICPDGGAMHLSAALGKPIVALFGDSPAERWRPWGVPHRVLQPDSRDLASLQAQQVLDACKALAPSE